MLFECSGGRRYPAAQRTWCQLLRDDGHLLHIYHYALLRRIFSP
jgi:hypothetical protein